MGGRHHTSHPLRTQREHVDAGKSQRPLAHRAEGAGECDVERAVGQTSQGSAAVQTADQVQRNPRQLLPYVLDQRRDEQVATPAGKADRHLSELPGTHGENRVAGLIEVPERLAHRPEQRDAGIGETHRSRGADEQRLTKLLLEPTNLLAERRLSYMQALRGASEVEILGDGHKCPQIAKFHPDPSRFSCLLGLCIVAPECCHPSRKAARLIVLR